MNQKERDKYISLRHTESGWYDLIKELDKKLSSIDPEYSIEQIKEKFGGLRFYFFSDSERQHEMLQLEMEYELLSYSICEFCGSREDVKPEGDWIKTLCKSCRSQSSTN